MSTETSLTPIYFKRGTQTKFDTLSELNPNSLYFTTDTGRLYDSNRNLIGRNLDYSSIGENNISYNTTCTFVSGFNCSVGGKAFSLPAWTVESSMHEYTTTDKNSDGSGWYYLGSVEGITEKLLEVTTTKKLKYTVILDSNFELNGEVLEVDATNNKIRVSNYQLPLASGATKIDSDSYLFLVFETTSGTTKTYQYVELGDKLIGEHTHAEGRKAKAIGIDSHAEGRETQAFGKYAHAEGRETVANYSAHAEGKKSKALGDSSHAEGSSTIASGIASHAEGSKTEATEFAAHAEGENSKATAYCSHAEGKGTLASEFYAHAEGESTDATGQASHAEGYDTLASGLQAHAEGQSSDATGEASHAEGKGTEASGKFSHAEGYNTEAIGNGSHAGGDTSKSNHAGSFVHGSHLTTGKNYQAVFGLYNAEDTSALFVIGNGGVGSPSNAFTVSPDGRATVKTGPANDMDVATKKYVDSKDTEIRNITDLCLRKRTTTTRDATVYCHRYADLTGGSSPQHFDVNVALLAGDATNGTDSSYKDTIPLRFTDGGLIVPKNPTCDYSAVSKSYVDKSNWKANIVQPEVNDSISSTQLLLRSITTEEEFTSAVSGYLPNYSGTATADIDLNTLITPETREDVTIELVDGTTYWGDQMLYSGDTLLYTFNLNNRRYSLASSYFGELSSRCYIRCTYEMAEVLGAGNMGDLGRFPKFTFHQTQNNATEIHEFNINLESFTEYRLKDSSWGNWDDDTYADWEKNIKYQVNVNCSKDLSTQDIFKSKINFLIDNTQPYDVVLSFNSSPNTFCKTFKDSDLKKTNFLSIQNTGLVENQLFATLESYDY